ncbi:ATP synthase subunit O, mitochondrial-like [Curcuma longa]|uniref:ATP synthase subunit O, mitochondrial-like n=1 Tax=Curcuma longa TaxID=136217 RepID=UPI003D9EC68E
MALSGRLRSAFPLLTKALSTESSVLCARSAAEGSLGSLGTGLRTFATQTRPTEAKVKVPLKLFGGSGNYATALFIAATKANALDKVEAEILDVVEASKKSPRFSKFIKDTRRVSEVAFNQIHSDQIKLGFDRSFSGSFDP